MAQPLPADQLKQVIGETLSPYAQTRKAGKKQRKMRFSHIVQSALMSASVSPFVSAEERLKAAQATPGHPLEVLRLIASSDAADAAVRQAAAVNFKNIIKKGWDVHREEGNEGIVISPQDRDTIKSHLVQLMCTTPPQIQVQLSESISLIAQVDYHQNWQNLLPELVQQFNSTDPAVIIGVIIKTANSIFKRF